MGADDAGDTGDFEKMGILIVSNVNLACCIEWRDDNEDDDGPGADTGSGNANVLMLAGSVVCGFTSVLSSKVDSSDCEEFDSSEDPCILDISVLLSDVAWLPSVSLILILFDGLFSLSLFDAFTASCTHFPIMDFFILSKGSLLSVSDAKLLVLVKFDMSSPVCTSSDRCSIVKEAVILELGL